MTPELLTVTEAGKLLNLSKAKAHELASRRIIPTLESGHHRGRMVRRSDLLALIDQWAAESTANDAMTTATPQRPTKTAVDTSATIRERRRRQ